MQYLPGVPTVISRRAALTSLMTWRHEVPFIAAEGEVLVIRYNFGEVA